MFIFKLGQALHTGTLQEISGALSSFKANKGYREMHFYGTDTIPTVLSNSHISRLPSLQTRDVTSKTFLPDSKREHLVVHQASYRKIKFYRISFKI